MMRPATIVGAGLAGSLLAIYLAEQGHDVVVYESRPDLRATDIDAGRSINLALATRGIVPLVEVGLIDRIDDITIAMRGRMVHEIDDDSPELLPYGTKAHDVIHSVSRTALNALLLDAAEATGRVDIQFERPVAEVHFDHPAGDGKRGTVLAFDDGSTVESGVLFGADGAGSRVRKSMIAAGSCTAHTDWLDHDYKELTLPAAADGTHQLDPNALHIWPRGGLMLIALANPGGDFTATLFAPKATFDELEDAEAVEGFFATEFADFAAIAPDLTDESLANPRGRLGTLWADGWSHGADAVLVGDAAHAIVPFHGQGMNAGFESVRLLDQHMRANPADFAAAFAAYEAERKPDTDAIAAMALDNYGEMRSSVVDPDYLARRAMALELEQRHPRHLSPRYNMVMFSTIPYADAKARADRQAEIIGAALADPTVDVDALVAQLPPLPEPDPLAATDALSLN